MRHWINLFERVNTKTYFHVTNIANVPSILKKGLLPNASNDGMGNYDNPEWQSLPGVYATVESDIIETYIHAHGLYDYAIVVLSVSPSSTLPDEDVIPIVLSDLFNKEMSRLMGRNVLFDRDNDEILEYFEKEYPDSEGQLPPEIIQPIALAFHNHAKGSDPRPADMNDIETAIECWWEFKIGADGDAAIIWYDLKDKLVRRYPKLAPSAEKRGYSVRIPNAVGFSGRNRITAIVEFHDDQGTVVYGSINHEARDFFGPYVRINTK